MEFQISKGKEIQMEIWKQVNGYEGLYSVSSFGRVRSEDRIIKNALSSTGLAMWKGKMLKQNDSNKENLFVPLCKDGKTKLKQVHRLVAEAFVHNEDPINLTIVNHKDENRFNNHYKNLEWCTTSYNNNYGTRKERVTNKVKDRKLKKRVKATNVETGVEKIYESLTETEQDGFKLRMVWKCCNGINKTHKGFYWEYYKEDIA